MRAMQRRSVFTYIPGYSNNTVLQLIMACGVAFILFHGTRVILLMVGTTVHDFSAAAMPNVALYTVAAYKTKFWTILTYGFLQNGFWQLLTNMLWLYCFGNLVQILVGHRQVFPIFIYSLVAGGAFYLLCQLIPGRSFQANYYLMGPQAGITGMAVASITLAPGYRFYLGDRLRIPLLLVAGFFGVLMVMNTGLQLPLLFLLLGGGLTGFAYIRLLKGGYRPGNWMYSLYGKMEDMVTPDLNTKNRKRESIKRLPSKRDISEKRIDEILDKINQRGYNSLTNEEKEILLRAGNDNS